MAFLAKMKEQAKKLGQEVTALYYACQHPGVGLPAKLLVLLTVGYALSPVDLIPDFIPVLGLLDDLIILPGLIYLALKLIPMPVMEASRKRAIEEPVSLKKNWAFALLFIGIWVLLIVVIVASVIGALLPAGE